MKSNFFVDNRGVTFGINISDLNSFDFKMDNILFVRNKKKYTLRGLHYQTFPFEQSKLVQCMNGKLYDVFVDLRKNSKTYLDWGSVILEAENPLTLFLPKGFAHGYLTLEKNTELFYAMNRKLEVENAKTIIYNDKLLKINWLHKPANISKNDLEGKSVKELLQYEK